jgi:hypothetical protein
MSASVSTTAALNPVVPICFPLIGVKRRHLMTNQPGRPKNERAGAGSVSEDLESYSHANCGNELRLFDKGVASGI